MHSKKDMVTKAQNKKTRKQETRKPENQKTRKPENQKTRKPEKDKKYFLWFFVGFVAFVCSFRLVLKGFPLTRHQPMQHLGHASSG